MSDIEELRKEMEQITTNMLKLLKSRTDIAKEIGHLKNKQGLTVTDESREDELRSKMIPGSLRTEGTTSSPLLRPPTGRRGDAPRSSTSQDKGAPHRERPAPRTGPSRPPRRCGG